MIELTAAAGEYDAALCSIYKAINKLDQPIKAVSNLSLSLITSILSKAHLNNTPDNRALVSAVIDAHNSGYGYVESQVKPVPFDGTTNATMARDIRFIIVYK